MANTIIVKFTKRSPTDSVKDANATAAVDMQFHSTNGGKFMKKLLSECKEHKALQSKLNEAYNWHKANTMPYLDNGMRMVNAELVEDYAAQISKFASEIDSLKRALEPVYAQAIQDDMSRLGNLANANDYLPWDLMKERYAIERKFLPKPEKQDYRFQIADKYKEDLDKMLEESKIAGRKELFQRAAKVVSTLKNSCDKTDATRRHESSITNIKDLADTMENLNVHDDAEVRYLIRDMLAVIDGITIWDLRNSETVRGLVSERCGKFLRDSMSGNFVPDVVSEDTDVLDRVEQEEHTSSNELVDSLV